MAPGGTKGTRDAVKTFAPSGYDCTLWGTEGGVTSLNDEGTIVVVSLATDEADRLGAEIGRDRLLTLPECHGRHPSSLTRLTRLLRRMTKRQ